MSITTVTTEAEARASLERRSIEYREKFSASRKDNGLIHPETQRYAKLWQLADRELADLDQEGDEE